MIKRPLLLACAVHHSCLPCWCCRRPGLQRHHLFPVRTEAEAVAAVADAKQLTDHFVFIEVVVDKRDAAPGAAVLRGAFLANHFDMAAYRKVASTQANSSMSDGLGLPPRHDGPQEVRSEWSAAAQVGALSAINGVAGSFAEELPVLSIVGVPSTRQYAGMCSLHHTLGNAEDMSQEVACYRPVTCYQTILRSYTDARYLIDKALTKALQHRKPVLLEVCRDIAMLPHASFGWAPPAMTPFAVPRAVSEPAALAEATAAVVAFFADKKMPLIIAGRRVSTCQEALLKLADASGWVSWRCVQKPGRPADGEVGCPERPAHDLRTQESMIYHVDAATDAPLPIATSPVNQSSQSTPITLQNQPTPTP